MIDLVLTIYETHLLIFSRMEGLSGYASGDY